MSTDSQASGSVPSAAGWGGVWPAALVAVVFVAAHALAFHHGEPVFVSDENRHVMTAIYFHDLWTDRPTSGLKEHAKRYYAQYPALGLMTWPPLFHAVCGTLMRLFGTSVVVAKLLVIASAAAACAYLFLLARRTHGVACAAGAALLFALSPLVFVYSQHVMLELPTVAFSMATLFHFVRYLDESRRRDLFVAALAAAGAALTRFDAVFLLPLLAGLIAVRRRFDLLRRPSTWLAAGLAVLLVLPYYALAYREAGAVHARQASQSLMPEDQQGGALRQITFYPSQLPTQLGRPLFVAACVGAAWIVGASLLRMRRRQDPGNTGDGDAQPTLAPWLCLIGATYVTFSPLAELLPRHTIYWVPAFAVLAADGVSRLARAAGRPGAALALTTLLALAGRWMSPPDPVSQVRGYEPAARYVVENSKSPVCLIDAWLDGNFTYQIRRLDPERRRFVLRGDKLLYSFLCVPETDYQEFARTDAEVIETIDRFAPEFIVVEDPLAMRPIPGAARLRTVLRNHPEQFALEQTIPVTGGKPEFQTEELRIYRNRKATKPVDRETLIRQVLDFRGKDGAG